MATPISSAARKPLPARTVVFSPDLKIRANVSGDGLIKNGLGEVSLAGTNNTFIGAITVNAGSLWAENSKSFGNTNTVATVNSGGSVILFGSVAIGAKPLVLNGTGVYGLGALAAGFGTNSWAGDITLASTATVSTYSSSDVLTLGGGIIGTSGLTKVGPGSLRYSGATTSESFCPHMVLQAVQGGRRPQNKCSSSGQ